MATTPRWALPYPAGADDANVPMWMQNLAVALDDHAKDSQGLLANRPVSTGGSPGKQGRYYWATDNGILYRDNGTGWDAIGPGIIPSGVLSPYAGTSAPAGWLLADGAVVSRTTYAPLFAVVGTLYNIGGEAGTDFRLPNFKGRMPVGRDAAQTEFDNVAELGGAKGHTLVTGEIPVHNHPVTDPGHSHQMARGDPAQPGSSGYYPRLWEAGAPYDSTTSHLGTGITVGNAGSGGSHQNMPPYVVVNYIIKT
jgi:microcystin-dependent protein